MNKTPVKHLIKDTFALSWFDLKDILASQWCDLNDTSAWKGLKAYN